jgi:hypothetical protein
VEQQECETVCSAEDFQTSGPVQGEKEERLDLYKAGGVVAGLSLVVAGLNTEWVSANSDLAMVIVFLLGYAGIIVEEELALNKAGVALVMASLCGLIAGW